MRQNRPSFKIIWSICMVFIYLAIAVVFVFAPIFSDESWLIRIIMGILLFAYGLFRAYRLWKEL
ncbi:MAG: hypothetical protein QM660_01140 [Dysgonomonas sp.]